LAINDLCNIVSTNSPLHKTIHLTSNVGLNNTVNLIWSHYEGVEFLSYNIYRGSTPTDMTLLATIASNLNSYTDLDPLVGNGYYFIEVEGIGCDPSRSIQTSRSNIINYSLNSVEEWMSARLKVYPNPTSDRLIIECESSMVGQEYLIFDVLGREQKKGIITNQITTIDTRTLSNGNYLLETAGLRVKVVVAR
jgi:hypothetical protein